MSTTQRAPTNDWRASHYLRPRIEICEDLRESADETLPLSPPDELEQDCFLLRDFWRCMLILIISFVAFFACLIVFASWLSAQG